MIRMLIAGSALVIAAVGVVSASDLQQRTVPVQAQPICVFVSTSGVVNTGPLGTCIPQYPFGVNCQTLTAGLSPTLDVTVGECSPH